LKYGLSLPAFLLLGAALIADRATAACGFALIFLAGFLVLLLLIDRRRLAWPSAAASLPMAVYALFALTEWRTDTLLGVFAFLFYLASIVLGILSYLATGGRRWWLLLPASLILACGIGEAAQPDPWWDEAQSGLIPWAPSMRWDIDRTTNYLNNFNNIDGIDLNGEWAPLARKPGEIRVVVMGSSPVIGAGVANMADTFPKLAERRLREWYPERDIHVYNAGQYAADIPNWVYYRDLIDRLKPDCLIYYTGEMRDPADVPRLVWARLEKITTDLPAEPALRRRAINAGTGRRPLIPLVEAWLTTRTGRNLRQFIAERRYDPAFIYFPAEASEIETSQTWTILNLFIEKVRDNGGKLLLGPGVDNRGNFTSTLAERCFRRAAAEYSFVHFWDVRDALTLPDSFLPGDLTHPTPAGHRRLGNSLAVQLKRLLLPDAF